MPPHSSDTGTSIGRGLTALCVVVVFLLVASLFGRFGMYFVTTGAAIYALARHGAEWRRIRDEQIARRRHGAPAGAPATRRLVLRPSLFTALGYIVGFGGLTAGILLAFMGVPWGTYLAFASAGVLVLWTMQMEEAGWRTSGRRRTRARRLRFVPWVRGGAPARPAVVATSNRERARTRPRDLLSDGGEILLWIIVGVVLLGGTAWALTTVMSR